MEIVAAPPEVPNKYQIIPIHGSDVASFLRCRRYWDWSSVARHNLRRKVQIYGINVPLWFGTGIHYALEMYYNPTIQRDPVEAFSTWFEYQWRGGVVSEEWLDRTYDNKPTPVFDTEEKSLAHKNGDFEVDKWKIQGLQEMLPDPSETEFQEYRDLGIGMMEYYKEYAAQKDDFVVVAAESVYSIPLGFKAIDTRVESPNFGEELDVHARGKRDTIVQNVNTELYHLYDYKTKTKFDEESYVTSLEMDPQCTNYIWASQSEAEIYDLPYKKINWIIYQAMRKNYPKPPTMTTRGLPSLNKQEEGTTAEMFKECIEEHNLQVWFEDNEKAQAYYTWLIEDQEEAFIRRTIVPRNAHQIANFGKQYKQIAMEMLDDPVVYPNPSSDYRCTGCQFRAPCLAKDDGSDFEFMLADSYEQNKDR